MEIFENELYIKEVKYIAGQSLPWKQLANKTIMISGATGMIGSSLVDVIMEKNRFGLNCNILALGRNEKRAKSRFAYCYNEPNFTFCSCDVNYPIEIDVKKIDYIFHLASNTHPQAYSSDPIGTITANIIGTKNLLDFASNHSSERVLFVSSVEIYGENRGDTERFDEEYCGYLDCNILRAGYPESKRCGEALCQAYISKNSLDVVIARLARTYGPTMLPNDTKALSQFIKNAVKGEDIVLKSAGTQHYSYIYTMDAVLALLTILLHGECGQAYNVAEETSDIVLKELAGILADIADTEVVFEVPDEIESAGYSKATKAVMNGSKLKQLGWTPMYSIRDGVKKTIDILKSIYN